MEKIKLHRLKELLLLLLLIKMFRNIVKRINHRYYSTDHKSKNIRHRCGNICDDLKNFDKKHKNINGHIKEMLGLLNMRKIDMANIEISEVIKNVMYMNVKIIRNSESDKLYDLLYIKKQLVDIETTCDVYEMYCDALQEVLGEDSPLVKYLKYIPNIISIGIIKKRLDLILRKIEL